MNENKTIKIWKIIRIIGCMPFLGLLIQSVCAVYKCLKLDYPIDMMGIYVVSWQDNFLFWLGMLIYAFWEIFAIGLLLIIVSTIKIKLLKKK